MNTGDIIAVYGAAVATVLAALQVWQHISKRPVLHGKLIAECDLPARHVEVIIANLTEHEIILDFLGLGYAWRCWWMPWKRICGDADGMEMFRMQGLDEIKVFGEVGAGQCIYASRSGKEQWVRRLKLFGRDGFDYRLSLYIAHSQSSKPLVVTLG